MARKKAAVVAINSLCTLKKVSLMPNHSFIPLKSLVLLNNLNTWAAEERSDFHSDGSSNSETTLNSQQYLGDFRVSGGGLGGTSVSHQNQYVQNGYYKESSQQFSSGVHGVDNPPKVDGQRQDFGDRYYGGIGHSSGQNGYNKQSSQQIYSGTHGPVNSNTGDGQRQGFGGQYYGGIGHSSSGKNGYYKESSQQISSGTHGADNSNTIYQKRQGFGGHYYGGIEHSSSGNNGFYKESSQQISSGTHGAGNLNTIDGQRQDFGGHHNGGVGYNSNGNFSYGAVNSSWQSRIPPHNSYDSFQSTGFQDRQNGGLASTSPPNFHLTQATYRPSGTGVGNTTSQQIYGDYQSGNCVQNANMPFHEPGGVMPEGQSSDDNSPQGTLEDLDAYCQDRKIKEAVEVLIQLEKQGIAVDLPRYLDLMKICEDEEALEEAKSIHEHLVKSISPLRVGTYNKILQMYARCGSMDDANTVFDKMLDRNLTSWDSMISGYALNGLGEEAITMFMRFKESGSKPDGQMFIPVFNACAVIGDVIEGMLHFESMNKVYGIVPNMKHYVSIVTMLGSCGYLDEAMEFIEKMPVQPNVDVWETLMDLSRVQGNSELGDRCAEIVEQMDPSRLTKETKGGLVAVKASDLSKGKDKKKSGQTSLELRSKIHEYRAGDKSHPENDKIYALLRGMKEQMKEAGYVPDCRFVLHDIDQEGKEEALMAHSERLATAYGLITSSARSPIRIIKNLRV
ncbi:hypothetical protein V2J09_019624 [Rumex salicifolius]